MNSRCILFFTLSLLILFLANARADIRIESGTSGRISIQETLFILEDPGNELGIEEIVSGAHGRQFKVNTDGRTGYGYSDSSYWIRLTIHKDPGNPHTWMLKHGYPHLDRLEFYAPDEKGGYSRIITGDSVPFQQRPFRNRLFLFPIDPEPEGTTYYLKLSSQGAINYPLSVVDHETFHAFERNVQLLLGIFFGALLIMAAYNLLFFVFVREKLYLFYALHLCCLTLYQINWFGYGFEHLWPGIPRLNDSLDITATSGIFFFLGLFAMDFLATKKHMPRLHYLLLGSTLLIGLSGFSVLVLDRALILVHHNNIMMVQILILFWAGTAGAVKGIRQAYIFLFAWSFTLAGALFLILYRNNLLPEIPLVSHSIQAGILMNVLLISLGLADRIDHMKNELGRLNKEVFLQNKKLRTACLTAESNEKRFRELSELLPLTVFELDREGRITYTNRQGLNTTGYTTTDLRQGLRVCQFLESGDQEKVIKLMNEMLAQRQVRQAEYVLIRKDGSRIPVSLYLNLITSGDTPSGFRGILIDVTEQKKTEELMIQTEKMMSVGGLAAGMAHELNNPLAGIIQNAQVIHNRLTLAMPANHRAAGELGTSMNAINGFMEKRGILNLLGNIRQGGNRAAKIIDNMLSFSRKSDSVKSPQALENVVDSALDLAGSDYDLKKQYDFKAIEIERAYAPDLPAVLCESSKIQQVIFNILKNASQAMSDWKDMNHPPKISIRLIARQGVAEIRIRDNGPGMDVQTKNKIFEPFFTTKGRGKGTGIGLSVSYFIIVDDHAGKMEVITAPGRGTEFIVQLPLA